MSIFFLLFITFFKIGLFTFGGGAAMIPILQQEVISLGWIGEEDLLRYIAISESTPGPIAINMATFVGVSQGGVLGAICATLGVVLPSFIIILLIASLFRNFSENKLIRQILLSIRPFVVGMILSAGVLLALSAVGITGISSISLDVVSLVITAILAVILFAYPKIFKKQLGVIPFIAISGIIGLIASLF